MPVELNHTIVHSRDADAAATFYSEVLGLPEPTSFASFKVVPVANGVSLDFMDADPGDIPSQHYAFLVSEDEFDEIWGRIKERHLTFYADPATSRPGETYLHNGGRGLYWRDPSGHLLEILTQPYSSDG